MAGWFLGGLLLGCMLGMLITSLCVISKRSEQEDERDTV